MRALSELCQGLSGNVTPGKKCEFLLGFRHLWPVARRAPENGKAPAGWAGGGSGRGPSLRTGPGQAV
ncbi:hypothetical protein GCM10010501_00300 [Streptomyces libani subsp. rufus]|nr:hypothetical protein GCM10010501_00300 [Streptomyces libani subsp. rufus]